MATCGAPPIDAVELELARLAVTTASSYALIPVLCDDSIDIRYLTGVEVG